MAVAHQGPAIATFGRAINNNGDIVGWHIGGGPHGFLSKSGNYAQCAQIDVPTSWSALGTTALVSVTAR